METIEYFESLRKDLVGRSIKFTRLAGNSLILYVDCEPGDKLGFTIWFTPTWHVKGITGVLVGSLQVETDEDNNGIEAFERGAESLLALRNKKILSLEVESLTYDLHLHLDGDFWVKTFVADPEDEKSWHIRDIKNKKYLIGSPHGLTQEDNA